MRPTREHATHNHQTYMVTSETWGRRSLFQVDRWAELLVETIRGYRKNGYELHEFVVMPDHFHVLLTPKVTLERAVQYIKGGFSFRAKKELGSNMEIWQKGFQDHRIRDVKDYEVHVQYIRQNPVRAGLCEKAEDYVWSSERSVSDLDPMPQGLKPLFADDHIGAAEAAPLQNSAAAMVRTMRVQSPPGLKPLSVQAPYGAAEAAPPQSSSMLQGSSIEKELVGAAKAARFQIVRKNKE